MISVHIHSTSCEKLEKIAILNLDIFFSSIFMFNENLRVPGSILGLARGT